MNRYRYQEPADRDYDAEARELIKGSKPSQLYALYEHVQKLKQRSQSPERDMELNAVAKAIESRKDLDRYRLLSSKNGYRSSMAADAKATDGNSSNWKKKS